MNTYRAPELKTFGTISSITQGNQIGDFLDENFPVNTPQPELTFSESLSPELIRR